MKISYRLLGVLATVLGLITLGGAFGASPFPHIVQAAPVSAPGLRTVQSDCDTVSCTTYLPLVLNSYPLLTEIELTQGAQLPDNSVMLIAGRETTVRLTLTDEREPQNVSAWLYASRGGEVLGPLAAWNNPRHLEATAQRSDLGDTFNFNLPTSWASGDVSFWAVASNGNEYSVETAPTKLYHFMSANPMYVTVVPIRYTCTNGGGTITPPAPYDYLVDDFTAKVYPTPYIDLAVHSAYNYSGPCTNGQPDPTFGDWDNLLDGVTAMWTNEGWPNSYYYGLLDVYCAYGCIAGYGWVGGFKAAVGFNGFGSSHDQASETHAHEVGHNHGRWHAPGCGAGNPDPNYPYADAYIGNGSYPVYGLDTETYTLYPYYASYDFMSYCGSEWVSDYTYEALYAYDNTAADQDRATETVPGPALLLSGELDATTGRAMLSPAYTLEGAARIPAPGDYTVELRDAQGKLLASYDFAPVTADLDRYPGGPSTQRRGFHLSLPAVEGVASARVLHDGVILGRMEAGSRAPSLRTGPGAQRMGGAGVTVSWAASEADGEQVHYMVRASTDGGASWQVLAVDQTTPGIALRPEDFGGQEVLVEVLASDGLHTTPLRLGPFEVPSAE